MEFEQESSTLILKLCKWLKVKEHKMYRGESVEFFYSLRIFFFSLDIKQFASIWWNVPYQM